MKSPKKKTKRLCLLALLLIVILCFNFGNLARILYPAKHFDHIKKYSAAYEVDPYLIMGIIKTESNFNADAVSHKNATGLMQIMKPTAIWLAEKMNLTDFSYENITNPELNIQMGCYYISYLLRHYGGNTENALAAYNAGEGTVDRWLKNKDYSADGKTLQNIPYPETRHYIEKVAKNRKAYRSLYKLPAAAYIPTN